MRDGIGAALDWWSALNLHLCEVHSVVVLDVCINGLGDSIGELDDCIGGLDDAIGGLDDSTMGVSGGEGELGGIVGAIEGGWGDSLRCVACVPVLAYLASSFVGVSVRGV